MNSVSVMKTNRREFMFGAGVFAAMNAFGDAAVRKTSPGRKGPFKICMFADIHYSPGTYPHSTKAWLKQVMDHAVSEKCDFAVQLGDFAKPNARTQDYIDYSQSFPIPLYHVLGNHDDGPTAEETFRRYGMKCGYYHFDHGGFRFIAMDPNYIYRGKTGKFEHYAAGNYFRYKKDEGDKIGMVPPEQLDWLKKTVDSSPYPCIILSHQSFERDVGDSCPNFKDVQRVFNEANARWPGRVRMAVNGHHHRDYVRIKDGMLYWDLNSASFEYIGEGRWAHDRFAKEWVTENKLKRRKDGKWPFLSWEAPIHSIVTLDAESCRIRSEGMEADYSCGVTPDSLGYTRADLCGRPVTAKVQSFDIRIGV